MNKYHATLVGIMFVFSFEDVSAQETFGSFASSSGGIEIDTGLKELGNGFITQELSVSVVGPSTETIRPLYYLGKPLTLSQAYCFTEGFKGKLDGPTDYAGFGAGGPNKEWALGARVFGNEGSVLNVWGRCYVFNP
ncbi:hypothetical protein [uncultured Roseibium sp.]|uniref:hypothetical protein n=1 Tax=uncultured Roseibium sp. TaxID=1936171 RepID=UPI00260FCE88|nr:hypothetical protein [uncultured Roseibium sp.]